MFLVILLPLVCPCLQENMPRIRFASDCLVIFTKLIVPMHFFRKVFFVTLAAMVNSIYQDQPPTSFDRRRTNVQQLTCKIDSSNSFYYLFFSFTILELKPLVLKGKVPGEKL